MPGCSVLHYLPVLAQTQVRWVSDAINCLIFCHPFLLLPSVFPSIRVLSNELALHIRWPKYWSFSFQNSRSNEYSGFHFLLYVPTLTSVHDYWENLTIQTDYLAITNEWTHLGTSTEKLFNNTKSISFGRRGDSSAASTLWYPGKVNQGPLVLLSFPVEGLVMLTS